MLLKVDSISKSFGAVQALKGVSFDLRAGEVHALVGENGAGKSTLIKIITGALQPDWSDSGSLTINGHRIVENSPSLAKRLGVAAIYQQPALFPDLSVAENLALGLERGGLWRRVNWRERNARARELLGRIGARIDPRTLAGALTMPEQQLVEIARALGSSPESGAKILIMDEPTASLTDRETEHLFKVIAELRAQGAGVIYISHRLEELFKIADRVTVLRDGETVATRAMNEVNHAEMIRLMVGRELSAVFPKREVKIGETVLEIRNLSSRAAGLRNVSLSVRAGEILGLTGLVGAGRTELARVLFGLLPSDGGSVFLRSPNSLEEVNIDSPAKAVELGVAYAPEDRRRHGAIMEMPIAANMTLAILDRISNLKFLDFESEKKIAVDFTARLSVKTPATFTPAGALSGGNQQKVALARWLATDPQVLILDEPTQGIDVGAKSEIHRLMCDLAEAGMAIIMISSELPEILGMSDRIAVMRGGTIVGVMERREATQQKIIELGLG
ncbi:MAG TPA: sugar ABC transporter ATP-binding protein [Blastocatellia bacterium]|jgi:rhamnose transport system ATP-binding protein|nr:sugar ABC transporter ATP-binding protein [Blastocatellia bacterium]